MFVKLISSNGKLGESAVATHRLESDGAGTTVIAAKTKIAWAFEVDRHIKGAAAAIKASIYAVMKMENRP